jgi:23S rRNA (guanine745-N1)-methyltransferase
VARSGYVNLLQPQDRRSPAAGDAKAAIEARARLLAAGVGRTIVEAFAQRAASLDAPSDGVIVDLGSGSGDALAAVVSQHVPQRAGVGVDLSTAAAEHAAKRFPMFTWVVANADRRLPLLDQSTAIVLSLHARRNPSECARVLMPNGYLLIAAPAHDDLAELREVIQGEAVERDRADRLVAEHQPFFTLQDRATVREQHHLERDALLDLLRGTYRGERTSAATRVGALTSLDVTLASTFFVFTRLP